MSALRFDLPELLYYYAQRGYEPDEILSILWSQNAGQIGLFHPLMAFLLRVMQARAVREGSSSR